MQRVPSIRPTLCSDSRPVNGVTPEGGSVRALRAHGRTTTSIQRTPRALAKAADPGVASGRGPFIPRHGCFRSPTRVLPSPNATRWFHTPSRVLVEDTDVRRAELLHDGEGVPGHCLGGHSSSPISGTPAVHGLHRPPGPALGNEPRGCHKTTRTLAPTVGRV